jgi:type II secretory pathway predicted ATPase ExeA/cell division septation protein DedD
VSALTYERFFGLNEKPFSLSSDPRFLYRSSSHARVFDTLLAGIERREGVLVLTGDIGTGKTTLCRAVLENLPRKTFSAFVPDPFASREDLLTMLLIDFGVISVRDLASGKLKGATRTELSYLLYDFLDSLAGLDAFVVVIIDEAQNLSLSLIEEIRILSDLHGRTSPLQVLFVGQLELRNKLKLPEMRQVDQRVSVHCSLEPLTREALPGYVAHRLSVAGASMERICFPSDALDAVYQASRGVPRLINRICDRTMYHSFLGKSVTLSRMMVDAAIHEAGGAELPGTLTAPATSTSIAVPPSWTTVPKPTPRVIDAWLKDVEVGPPSVTVADGLGAFSPESEVDAVQEPREPQWFLGTNVVNKRRTKWWRRPGHGISLPSIPGGVTRKVARATAAGLILVGALSGMGLAMSRLPSALDGSAMPPPAAPASASPATSEAPAVVTSSAAVVVEEAVAAAPITAPAAAPTAPATPTVSPAVTVSAATPAPVAAPVVAPTEPAASGSYVLQVGLFGSADRGARLVEELTAQGFRAFQQPLNLGTRGLFQQVLIGTFETRAEADRDLERLRQRGGHDDARVATAKGDKETE